MRTIYTLALKYYIYTYIYHRMSSNFESGNSGKCNDATGKFFELLTFLTVTCVLLYLFCSAINNSQEKFKNYQANRELLDLLDILIYIYI